MEDRSPNGLSNRANATERTDHEQREYQFGGDYVISSGASPGAWIAAEHPMLAVDQIDTEAV